MTKLAKKVLAARKSKQKRMAEALRKFLKTANPALGKGATAKVRRNKSGYTIIVGKAAKVK